MDGNSNYSLGEQVKNPPAFPLHNGDVWGGMCLRDYFAARALAAMMRDDKMGMTELGIARMSYHIADAMLKARQEPPET